MDEKKILANLTNNIKVVRAKAVGEMMELVQKNKDGSVRSSYEKKCLELLESERWQDRQAGYMLGKELCVDTADEEFSEKVFKRAMQGLSDKESRVRMTVAEVLRTLCERDGLPVYKKCKKQLLKLVHDNFDRPDEKAKEPPPKPVEDTDEKTEQPRTKKEKALAHLQKQRRILEEKLGQHDTEGWKTLYSAFKTLEQCVRGCGESFEPEMTDDFFNLVVKSTKHINRFVRECAYQCLEAICHSSTVEGLCDLAPDLSILIAYGLSDNWSQVRHASSVAVRSFLAKLPQDEGEKYYPALLPPMCLNRYYVAAGVRIYSQETWVQLMSHDGPQKVAEHIECIVQYYRMQAEADNHAVREAACHCISELSRKVDREAVKPHVRDLLDALIACFKDESWPVRDAACTALGGFVSTFPESSSADHEELFELWFAHLSDNIPSVRENTAISLGKVVAVLGPKAVQKVVKHLTDALPQVFKQPKEAKSFSGLEKTTTFGVAKRVADPMDPKFVDQALFSCGSLAPKLKRATRCGCMDHGFSRPQEPWEKTDGAVHLLAQLAAISNRKALKFVPTLIEIARARNFSHFHHLQMTVWQVVPVLAKKLGAGFEFYLETILEELATTARNPSRLAACAATTAYRGLKEKYGEQRLEDKMSASDRSSMRKALRQWV